MLRPAHVLSLLLAAALLGAVHGRAQPQPCSDDPRAWCPATYRGLTLGRSTVDDAVRALGAPRATVAPPEGDVWMGFDAAGALAGRVDVWADPESRVLRMVVLHPAGVSRDSAVRIFGAGYVETRYAPDECAEGEIVPLVESPGGPILQLEYRGRGIALSLTPEGDVHEVLYLTRPVSEPRSSCAG